MDVYNVKFVDRQVIDLRQMTDDQIVLIKVNNCDKYISKSELEAINRDSVHSTSAQSVSSPLTGNFPSAVGKKRQSKEGNIKRGITQKFNFLVECLAKDEISKAGEIIDATIKEYSITKDKLIEDLLSRTTVIKNKELHRNRPLLQKTIIFLEEIRKKGTTAHSKQNTVSSSSLPIDQTNISANNPMTLEEQYEIIKNNEDYTFLLSCFLSILFGNAKLKTLGLSKEKIDEIATEIGSNGDVVIQLFKKGLEGLIIDCNAPAHDIGTQIEIQRNSEKIIKKLDRLGQSYKKH